MHVATMTLTVALLCSASAAVQADRFELGLGGGTHFVPMDSMDALSNTSGLSILTLSAAIKLPELVLPGKLEAQAALNWEFGTLRGTTFERVDSDLEMDFVTAVGRVRWPIGPVHLVGDAGLGIARAKLSLADSTGGRPISGKAPSLMTTVGTATELTLLSEKQFEVLLRLHLSYELMSSMHFAATPMSNGDTLQIPVRGAELGSVNASGASLRFGVAGRF